MISVGLMHEVSGLFGIIPQTTVFIAIGSLLNVIILQVRCGKLMIVDDSILIGISCLKLLSLGVAAVVVL